MVTPPSLTHSDYRRGYRTMVYQVSPQFHQASAKVILKLWSCTFLFTFFFQKSTRQVPSDL